MNKGLEESNIDPPVLEQELEPDLRHQRAESRTIPSPLQTSTNRSWLRLAYAIEFFIAVLAILTLWSEVGGQGHLDLIPWYIKLICVLGSAWCCVRFTAGIAEQTSAWNRRSAGWLAGIVFFVLAMGAITYYYHLHEDSDDDSDDPTGTVSIMPGSQFYYTSDRTWRGN